MQELKNALSAQERQAVLAVAQSEEFGHLCPSQIVPRLADQGQYIASSEQHTSSSTVEPSGPVQAQQTACAGRHSTHYKGLL